MLIDKRILLAGAAILTVSANAMAADLPSRKSAPAEYVKICDAYGAGFFYIPGTDTCLKIGGMARGEFAYIQPGNVLTIPTFKGSAPAAGVGNTTFVPSGTIDSTGFTARGRVELDARTQTAWGTARTFIGIRGTYGSGLYTGADNYTTNLLSGQSGAASITVENAFVQFAGFTFGHTNADIYSYFPPYWYNVISVYGSPSGFNILSYTATFGGGLSATIGIEDRGNITSQTAPGYTPNQVGGGIVALPAVAAASSGQTGGAFANGPYALPVLMGNIRYDQPWGNIQVMGALAQNTAVSTLIAPSAGGSNNFTITNTGWALGAGVRINLPSLAAGDHIYLTGSYTNGLLDAASTSSTSSHTGDIGRALTGLLRLDRSMYVIPSAAFGTAACPGGAATTTAACFTSEQTSAWSVATMFTHYWTPSIRSVLLASYLSVTPGNRTQNTDWTLGGLSKANLLELSAQLVWSPVANLDIGAEIAWERLNQNLTGTNGAAPTAVPVAMGGPNYNPSSSALQGRIRFQRQF